MKMLVTVGQAMTDNDDENYKVVGVFSKGITLKLLRECLHLIIMHLKTKLNFII